MYTHMSANTLSDVLKSAHLANTSSHCIQKVHTIFVLTKYELIPHFFFLTEPYYSHVWYNQCSTDKHGFWSIRACAACVRIMDCFWYFVYLNSYLVFLQN